MDFQRLSRRDLQFFCKRNKIPANMTNIAMADALQALEIVDGIDEFMNQSPTSMAKDMPSAARTAARTTRRKAKDETQPSELVTRSCYVVSKSLAGEMEQENRNSNVLGIPSVPQSRRSAAATSVAKNLEVTEIMPETNVSKTPAARSTRRTQVAASSKKEETVQRVYSTRRSVKLLEESMADLSLKTNVPAKKSEDAEKEDSPAGSKSEAKLEKTEEAEVISVRDLSDSLEKEWDGLKNDPDVDILYGDLGDITFFDANTTKEQFNGIDANTVSPSDSFVLVEEQVKRQEDDFVVVNHAASTTTNILACNKESESEQMKIDSECESDETEYETDPGEEDDDSDVAVDSNHEAFESKVSASKNVSKVDSVTTVPIPDDTKKVKSEKDSEEEEMCKSDELTDNESEVTQVSDKTETQASSFSPLGKKEVVESDSDEWSEYEIEDINEMDLGPAADNNENKSKENDAEMGGESKAEAEGKKKNKKKIDEESLKDVSMRQLTKLVKELAIKNKQHKSLEE